MGLSSSGYGYPPGTSLTYPSQSLIVCWRTIQDHVGHDLRQVLTTKDVLSTTTSLVLSSS